MDTHVVAESEDAPTLPEGEGEEREEASWARTVIETKPVDGALDTIEPDTRRAEVDNNKVTVPNEPRVVTTTESVSAKYPLLAILMKRED